MKRQGKISFHRLSDEILFQMWPTAQVHTGTIYQKSMVWKAESC